LRRVSRESFVTKTPAALDERDKERIREGLERELACLRALGVPPERFEAARHARSLRRRKPDGETNEFEEGGPASAVA
jgi:hypothetical protein